MNTQEREQEVLGGFKFGAAFFGWLVAIAITAILGSLVSAAGVGLALTRPALSSVHLAQIGFGGALLWLITIAIAYYAGGYVAGRMARYDGGAQGVGVWVISIVVAILLAIAGSAFGAAYNVLAHLNVPRIPVSEGIITAGGFITLLLAVIISALAAIWGGQVGAGYHRTIDRKSAMLEEDRTAAGRAEPSFGERIEHQDRR